MSSVLTVGQAGDSPLRWHGSQIVKGVAVVLVYGLSFFDRSALAPNPDGPA